MLAHQILPVLPCVSVLLQARLRCLPSLCVLLQPDPLVPLMLSVPLLLPNLVLPVLPYFPLLLPISQVLPHLPRCSLLLLAHQVLPHLPSCPLLLLALQTHSARARRGRSRERPA